MTTSHLFDSGLFDEHLVSPWLCITQWHTHVVGYDIQTLHIGCNTRKR